MPKSYISRAQWPRDVASLHGDRTTSDFHETKQEAQGVCELLETQGFGGDGSVFPLRTWVESRGE